MELQTIQKKIYEIRGHRVMLDFDLADLYDVETKVLNQAVKRNSMRFPEKFMFRLNYTEWELMRSQNVTASNQKKRNINITPFAFTEHGVTMLASVLRSEKAIQMNIAIVEAFISIKEIAINFNEVAEKLRDLENQYNKKFSDIYQALDYLLKKDKQEKLFQERNRIGFKTGNSQK